MWHFSLLALIMFALTSESRSICDCADICSLLPPLDSSYPCYQGKSENIIFLRNNDPLVPPEMTSECGTCQQYGYTNYVSTDPVYHTVEIWTEGGHYSESKAHDGADVTLEVFYECGHPSPIQFLSGPLADLLDKRDMRDIITFKIVPHGGFSASSQGFLCRSDDKACPADAYSLCVLYKFNEDAESIHNGATSFASWPFLRCMASHDDNPTKAESCFEQSMNGSGLEWSAVRACATSEYDCVVAASVAATPQRNESHLKVLVNGKMITSPGKTLLAEVCKAFKGKAPRSCELE